MSMTAGVQALIQAVNDFIFVQHAPQKADILFVPGSNQPENALHAAALYRAGYAPLVLPSGRYAKHDGRFAGVPEAYRTAYPDDYDTEWAFFRAVLLRGGVPASAILQEDQATFTWDNARRSRQVTEAQGLTIRRALLCCKPFHARRALLYYQAAFPETDIRVCPAALPGFMPEDWFLTPEGRETVLGEVQRLGSQVGEVFQQMLSGGDCPRWD